MLRELSGWCFREDSLNCPMLDVVAVLYVECKEKLRLSVFVFFSKSFVVLERCSIQEYNSSFEKATWSTLHH